MIKDWLKNEEDIYNMSKDLKNTFGDVYTGIDDIRIKYYKYLETKIMEGKYAAYPADYYMNIPPGIETDGNNLRQISIVIANWERHYYIPLIMEMYQNQNYPKNLLEFIIVDDDSVDKTTVLNIVKDQVRLYPDFKIRFIQNYINKCQNSAKRLNIGIRHSSYDIVIINGTDTIPLGRNYLRGICYMHNIFKNISCVGITFDLGGGSNEEFDITDIYQVFNVQIPYGVSHRISHDNVMSFNKELVSKIRGYDEKSFGWGGNDGNMANRYVWGGGRLALNTYIYSAWLPNFPRRLPPGITKGPSGGNWQNGVIINDENWGISEKMEEINLY